MATILKSARTESSLPENALARTALEAIEHINREARQKKQAQVEALNSAKAAIHERIYGLNHQLAQIDAALASISGRAIPRKRQIRRNLDEERERVGRWMIGRRGQKFRAGDLIREFPELDGTVMSVFLKPLVQEGKVQLDKSEGSRRPKYFVAE